MKSIINLLLAEMESEYYVGLRTENPIEFRILLHDNKTTNFLTKTKITMIAMIQTNTAHNPPTHS